MMSFKPTAFAAVATLLALTACAPADTAGDAASDASPIVETGVMVGGAEMLPSRNIIENAVNSADHTTLVSAIQAAGLVETLSGPGPFTVFAPTNAAFAKLPEGTVETLTQAANIPTLTSILTYHVVAGRITAADLISQIQAGGGAATLTTVQGATLTGAVIDGSVVLTDAAGNQSTVTTADVLQSNGVIHVVDTVVMPPQA